MSDKTDTSLSPESWPINADGCVESRLTALDLCRTALDEATAALERASEAAAKLAAIDVPAYANVEVRRAMVADAIEAATSSIVTARRRLVAS